jgi:pSer/pThr/pTyr-binding forkhead associated (FHA) protein
MSRNPAEKRVSGGLSGQFSGTSLEPVEELRSAAKSGYTPTVKPAADEPDTIRYRPLRRPPMAALCILHDGRDDGEWVRVCGERLVIGRTDGDVVIPHDGAMSSRHAEIVRRAEAGAYRWYLVDLQSSNGVFVRIGRSLLKHGDELLLGSRRYRFDAAPAGSVHAAAAVDEDPPGTRSWSTVRTSDLLPSLEYLSSSGQGQRYLITGSEAWIGRDRGHCNIVLEEDLMVSPRHAHLFRDGKGRWIIENAGSLNGTWLRMQTTPVDGTGQFQLGEQRFLLRVF